MYPDTYILSYPLLCVFLYGSYLHSYDPIGFRHGSCPPKDWRNPPVIDMYNQIMKRLCNMYNITFIGTDDIIGVTWDRARDWNHYNDTSGLVEAEYMLFKLFSNKQ